MAEETQSITTRHGAETDPALWWRQAVVYQVYPRSFQDTTGSGLGDINGITGRIPYLRQLGVDAIWLSPFYPSELADGGYDVADYRDVDPKLGSMDDFDRLAAAAHAADIKVVVDIVPNHSSHLHPWFRQALADGPGSPARDRYIFRDEEGHPQPIWKAALRHTLEIFVFIFVFSLVFGLIVEGVGEDVFASVLGRMGFFQPVVAALVGLVPNCAASVLMTQLYVEGALRFSSLVAGLCTGAGVGLAVLWRVNPSWKQNLFITGLTWACGAAVGVGIQIVVAFIA